MLSAVMQSLGSNFEGLDRAQVIEVVTAALETLEEIAANVETARLAIQAQGKANEERRKADSRSKNEETEADTDSGDDGVEADEEQDSQVK